MPAWVLSQEQKLQAVAAQGMPAWALSQEQKLQAVAAQEVCLWRMNEAITGWRHLQAKVSHP